LYEVVRRDQQTGFCPVGADELDDPDDAVVVVWLALAHTRSKLGRLDDGTRRQAMSVLESGGDVDRGARGGREGPAFADGRAAAHTSAAQGPQPARRSVRRPAHPISGLTAGQVLGYRGTSGRFYLLRIVRIIESQHRAARSTVAEGVIGCSGLTCWRVYGTRSLFQND
jgi:hypothetical protein